MRALFVAALLTTLAATANAHSGRTDSKGGHFNRKTGEYHYHGGGSARSDPPPQQTVEVEPEPPPPVTPRTVPRTIVRTAPRTTARTGYTIGSSASELIERMAEKEEEPPAKAKESVPAKPAEKPQYRAFMTSGRTKDLLDFSEAGTSFTFYSVGGGKTTYPKSIVERIESMDGIVVATRKGKL